MEQKITEKAREKINQKEIEKVIIKTIIWRNYMTKKWKLDKLKVIDNQNRLLLTAVGGTLGRAKTKNPRGSEVKRYLRETINIFDPKILKGKKIEYQISEI